MNQVSAYQLSHDTQLSHMLYIESHGPLQPARGPTTCGTAVRHRIVRYVIQVDTAHGKLIIQYIYIYMINVNI